MDLKYDTNQNDQKLKDDKKKINYKRGLKRSINKLIKLIK